MRHPLDQIVKQIWLYLIGCSFPGALICMASGPISWDPEVVEDPDVFGAFRFVKQKTLTSGFVSTRPNNMHFGLGR